MKNLKKLILTIISVFNIYCAQPNTVWDQDKFATHCLAIFVNDIETQLGALSKDLMSAISEKNYPILVSTSLLSLVMQIPDLEDLGNILENTINQNKALMDEVDTEFNKSKENTEQFIQVKKTFNKLLDKLNNALEKYNQLNSYNTEVQNKIAQLIDTGIDFQEIINQLNQEFPDHNQKYDHFKDNEIDISTLEFQEEAKKFLNRDLYETTKSLTINFDHTLAKESIHWNPEDWIIKIVDPNNSFILLIPKKYSNKYLKPFASCNQQKFTEAEYALGFKIDHMQTLKSMSLILDYKNCLITEDYSLEHLTNNLFINNQEYILENKCVPKWAIFMTGHGGEGYSSCGLALNTFSNFLNFLQTKIQTSILAYNSCHAIGLNSEILYGDIQKNNSKKFSFPILTQGYVKQNTKSEYSWFRLENFGFFSRKINFKSSEELKYFFKYLMENNEIDIFKASNELYKLTISSNMTIIPQVRLPNKEYFEVINDVENQPIINLGSILVYNNQQVNLSKHFKSRLNKSKISYCLLNSSIIPCELILNCDPDDRPYFIPMSTSKLSSDEAFYYIKKITAPKLSIYDIINLFYDVIKKHAYNILIFIDQLDIHPDSVDKDATDTINISNFLFTYNAEERELKLYYTYNNKKFFETDKQPKMEIKNNINYEIDALIQTQMFVKKHLIQKKIVENLENKIQKIAQKIKR